jgi:hypothetical protein
MDLGKKRGSGTGHRAPGCSRKQHNPVFAPSPGGVPYVGVFVHLSRHSIFPFVFVSQVWPEHKEGGWYMILIEFYLLPRLSTGRHTEG